MPELPEVEVTRRSFVAAIESARIDTVYLGKPLRWPLGYPPEALAGRTVRTVGRRGKYLLIELSQGWLLLHLGMSGSLRFARDLPAPGVHDHFELVTSQGTLRLHDPRRFGAVVYADSLVSPVALKLLGHLGVEPLSDAFGLPAFAAGLKARQTAIKQVLMGGTLVVGVGNIYASEALFMAGIRPTSRANKLSRPRVVRLQAAIRDVLARAVEQGGSSLRDFSNADGQTGYFQLEAMVYGRAGLPCRHCGSAIKMIRQGQRSTFYCPVCQKA
ncbi:bifunctional DNA-formamidopyrimidine glycosylase/DNA-(apurinic or apyrimidinic site) lyase [Rhodoferax antarcticus]|uniref:bifunctional DNA-formamidopyrimidine glycosylase/DNA-(apurinic or apyrimidinic site) lyase n=1 Tax=Rhodoferax antarcticus TaxID=81479 RepID=UPI0022245E22|nr:bifunctional DNA-formamidopyrimidine glycosylase/DNA-(apurinic or apyrimidinic site) lyase [Rhodoferax antarcticus]MCW2311946.1 formamidopyrimidine-DNA glycosylase [Rhodoferax antarcticus]